MSPEIESPTETVELDPARPLRDPAREAFCQELTAGEELYAAYETAGFSRPRGNAQRMLHEPEVAARIGYLHSRVAGLDEVLIGWRRLQHRRALENIASANRLGLFEEKTSYVKVGKRRKRMLTIALRPIDDLTPEQRALIDGIEITDKGGLKVLMPKRLEARAMLAKLDGLDKPTKMAPTNPNGDGPAVLDVRWREPAEAA